MGEQDGSRGLVRWHFFVGLGEDHAGEALGVIVDRSDDLFRGGEVFLCERWLDEESVAYIIEAFAAGAIGWKIAAREEVDAEEVADSVIVFVSVEAADGCATRIPRKVAGFELFEDGLDLVCQ